MNTLLFHKDLFKPITLNTKTIFTKYYEKYQPECCDYSFVILFLYANSDIPYIQSEQSLLYLELSDHLYIGAFSKSNLYCYLPIGPEPETIINNNPDIIWIKIPEKYIVNIHFKMYKLPNDFDYIYLISNLVYFTSSLGKYRRHVQSCLNKNTITYYPITQEHTDSILNFTKTWNSTKKLSHSQSDYYNIENALKNYNSLQLYGMVFFIDNKFVGYRIYSQLNNNTIVSHFAKHDINYSGLSEVILHIICKQCQNFTYINLEQDLGILGLRKHKLMLQPHTLYYKYNKSTDN